MNFSRNFASDNSSGVHPDIMNALVEANKHHTIAYGNDDYTNRAIAKFKTHFGEDIQVFFVFGGTGANVLSLKALTNSFHSVICAETSHINVDECGAPEKFTGCKLLPIRPVNGKLTPAKIKPLLHGFDFEHHSQPKVISITQATELGTVYRPDEIKAITDLAKQYHMFTHMDGARISNASAFLDLPFSAFTREVGIDVLSFGGTKNGMMYGEAVVFFNHQLAENFKYLRKQAMQLASKMRFISTQFETYLSNDLWLKNARHANHMAKRLAEKLTGINAIKITQPIESNAVFAEIPAQAIDYIRNKCFFYVWNEETSEVRWMASFDTTLEDIDNFVKLVKSAIE